MNELVYGKNPIDVTAGAIRFNAYEAYKAQALQIADYIYNTDVTEETIKEAKEVIANARKVVNNLETRRKQIKNDILAPYKEFETQIKEIVSIIDDADKEVRAKVNDLAEQEREAKKEHLRQVFWEKAQWMVIGDAVPDLFEHWLTPQHLNKSTSIKQCESSMAEWLKEKEDGFDTLMLTEDEDLREDYLTEYCKTLDLTSTLMTVQQNRQIQEKVKEATQGPVVEETGIFIVSGKANIKLVQMLLNENGIEFKFRKGE